MGSDEREALPGRGLWRVGRSLTGGNVKGDRGLFQMLEICQATGQRHEEAVGMLEGWRLV